MKGNQDSPSLGNLIKGSTPLLIDFYTDWCGPCKMMNPILREVKKMMGDRINIIKIDAEKNPDVAIQYNVRGCLHLFYLKRASCFGNSRGWFRRISYS